MKKLLSSLILVFGISMVTAQNLHVISGYIIAQGTSNVREWKISTDKVELLMNIVMHGDQLTDVKDLKFSFKVKDLKSRYPLMDRRVYKALKGHQNNRIYFNGVNFKVSPSGDQKYLVKSEGNLGIAGFNQIATLMAVLELHADGTMTCSGTHLLKMSAFNVSPPIDLVKNMEIGENVIVNFDFLLAK